MSLPPLEITLRERPRGVVAHAVLNAAKSLNLVDRDFLTDARAALDELLANDDVRCLCLTGPTERAFVGGANLHALRELDATTAEAFIRSVDGFCTSLRTARVPVVAVMRGFCLGAGLEMAAACDIRIGDHSVRCGMPEVQVGVPSVVEAALLPGLIGWGKARELMLRGNIIDAEESLAIGLLQHLVNSDELETLAESICADVLSAGPLAVAAQKRLFLAWEEQPMSAAIDSGVAAFVEAYGSDEPQTAINAFFTRGNTG